MTYHTPPKAIKLPSGARMTHGMIIGGDPMLQPRKLNSAYNIARDGAPKRTAVAQPVPGQVRQTTGEPHAFLHGQTVDDAVPVKSHEGNGVPVHPGMTDKQRAAIHPIANDPSVILKDAANLGRKPEKA